MIFKVSSTNLIQSSIEIQNLVISELVIGKNLFVFINSLKNGITLPLEFMTFPYLTTENIDLFLLAY